MTQMSSTLETETASRNLIPYIGRFRNRLSALFGCYGYPFYAIVVSLAALGFVAGRLIMTEPRMKYTIDNNAIFNLFYASPIYPY